MTRAQKTAQLRAALSRYAGGRFETGSSGGANGMVFFNNAKGEQFYIGGFNASDAESIVTALNLTLELLGSSDVPAPGHLRRT